jgi:hypothetical protein
MYWKKTTVRRPNLYKRRASQGETADENSAVVPKKTKLTGIEKALSPLPFIEGDEAKRAGMQID